MQQVARVQFSGVYVIVHHSLHLIVDSFQSVPDYKALVDRLEKYQLLVMALQPIDTLLIGEYLLCPSPQQLCPTCMGTINNHLYELIIRDEE